MTDVYGIVETKPPRIQQLYIRSSQFGPMFAITNIDCRGVELVYGINQNDYCCYVTLQEYLFASEKPIPILRVPTIVVGQTRTFICGDPYAYYAVQRPHVPTMYIAGCRRWRSLGEAESYYQHTDISIEKAEVSLAILAELKRRVIAAGIEP